MSFPDGDDNAVDEFPDEYPEFFCKSHDKRTRQGETRVRG